MAERSLRILGVGDGRSINFLRFGRRLAERGHEVHIVSDRITDREQDLEGITAHDVRTLEPLTQIPVVRRARFGPAIARLADELDIDVVHAHYLLPYGYWAAKADRHPLVMSPWSRDVFVDAEEGRGRQRAIEAIEAADYFVLNSYANEKASVALGANPDLITHIIWYAELDRFGQDRADPELRSRLGWPDDAIIVLSLRNFRPYTNVDVVVKAFARAAKSEPRARLILSARGGPTRPEIERLVDELGIRDRVAFNRAEVEELPALVAACDLGITIADSDSTPASLLEVMASRLPVVAGTTWSIDEWVEDGQGGVIVSTRDEDAITAALEQLLADPDLRKRYGEHNERLVRERLPEPGPALEELYLELLKTPASV